MDIEGVDVTLVSDTLKSIGLTETGKGLVVKKNPEPVCIQERGV